MTMLRSNLPKLTALVAALLLAAPAAHASPDQRCYVPPFLVEPGHALARVAEAAKSEKKLSVLVISGSPSQVGGTKGLRSYPAYLENALRRNLPGIEVTVDVRAKARQSVADLLPLVPAMVAEAKPSLVVWQMGTVDTFRQSPLEAFGRGLRQGLAAIADAGADTVLLDMQYSPRTDQLVDYPSYLDAIRDISENARVPLFDRYEIMRYWSVAGSFDLSSLRDDGLYEKIHVCIGELLADFILRGAGLKEGKGIGG